MLYKPIVSLIVAFAAASSAAASATPLGRRGNGGYAPPYAPPVPVSQCAESNAKCCNTYTSSNNPDLVGLLGQVLGPNVVGVGLGCSVLSGVSW